VLFVLGTAFLELSAHPQEAPEGPGEDATVEVYRVPVDNAPVRGPADALVTIVAFSDFQCPFCSRVVPTLEQVVATYGNDVRIVFRQNPLPFHPNAMPAAEASLEAYAQRGPDGFWAMHDLLFVNQRSLGRADLERYAALLQLDLPRFRLALDNHVHQAAITADQALATQIGANGTPAFFINGRMLMGAQPFASFQETIDAARADALARSATVPRAQLYASIIEHGLTAPAPPPPEERDPSDDPTRVWDVGNGAGHPSRGPAQAPVTIQIFSDFQCPFCSRATETIEQILQVYAGRVRVVFRQYPLPFHAWAREAAQASIEVQRQAGDQGFWQFHDLLFENQREIGAASSARAELVRLAAQVPGVNARRVEQALVSAEHDAAVQADIDAIERAGVEIGTPSFFLNGRLIQGARPLDAFRPLIDELLAPN
jgi:protein-disulfide isomerase